MNATKLTKICFSNRDDFNNSVEIVFHVNTRQLCDKPLTVEYADMIYTFWDEYHADRAICRLREKGINTFNVERNA
jgi:hypothetical protein